MNAPALKVLVIDDEAPIRKLLRMRPSTQGYEILEAANAKMALDLLPRNPDLIILDLGLPDIHGHELLRMIRARNALDAENEKLRVAMQTLESVS